MDLMEPIILLKDSKLKEAVAHEHSWTFEFGSGVSILAECHWRLSNVDGILVTDEDHQQKFGLPQPVNAADVVATAIDDSAVTEVTINGITSDLRLNFANGTTLEVLPNSSGYENWHVRAPNGTTTMAAGGGKLSAYRVP